MERTRAISVVRKQALSFGNQKTHIAAEMESTSLLQDLLQRKGPMELSDKAAFGLQSSPYHVRISTTLRQGKQICEFFTMSALTISNASKSGHSVG